MNRPVLCYSVIAIGKQNKTKRDTSEEIQTDSSTEKQISVNLSIMCCHSLIGSQIYCVKIYQVNKFM